VINGSIFASWLRATFEMKCPIKDGNAAIKNLTVGFPPIMPFPLQSYFQVIEWFGKSK
jgi:hypothetical protein